MRIYDRYYEERLYSTGDYELDDLLEKAFCDGYYYAQKEFINVRLKTPEQVQHGIERVFKRRPGLKPNKAAVANILKRNREVVMKHPNAADFSFEAQKFANLGGRNATTESGKLMREIYQDHIKNRKTNPNTLFF